jgi:hypothetical protein
MFACRTTAKDRVVGKMKFYDSGVQKAREGGVSARDSHQLLAAWRVTQPKPQRPVPGDLLSNTKRSAVGRAPDAPLAAEPVPTIAFGMLIC